MAGTRATSRTRAEARAQRSRAATARLTPPPKGTVLDAIAERVEEQPGHPALDDGTTILTFGELWARADLIARHLAGMGVTTGTPVLVWGPRSTAYAAAFVAVLRAGAVAVPCSTMFPDARCTAMAAQASATHAVVVGDEPAWTAGLTTMALGRDALPRNRELPAAPPASPGPYAVISYTSGTMGATKCVRNSHATLAGIAAWHRTTFAITPSDRVTLATNVGFVATLRNLFGSLAAGATVCPAPDTLLPEQGLSWLWSARVTVAHTTPTTARSWLDDAPTPAPRPTLRWTIFAGEPLPDTTVTAWRAAVDGSGRVANAWGATELGGSRAWFEVPPVPLPGVQPIEHASPQTQLFVVRDDDTLCDDDEPGELLVRASDLPDGYLDNTVETRRRFTTNPFRRSRRDRVFRTGDRAWHGADGRVHLAGRLDDQIKLGGFRLEPSDIVTVLRDHPAVVDAHIERITADDATTLTAFVVVANHDTVDASALAREFRTRCASHLPLKAVPARFILLERFPVAVGGKLDRSALRALALPDTPATVDHGDPRPDPTAELAQPAEINCLDDIARSAATYPQHVALTDGTRSKSYAEMWDRAGTVAEHLAGLGVRTGTPVMVSGPRSVAFATAFVGVLRAGGIVVPCSTMLPDDRCATMASELDARHAVVIGPAPSWTRDHTTLELDDDGRPTAPDLPLGTPAPTGEHAYVFFTSGTTGAPKAVLGRHRSLAAYLRWWREAFAVTPDDRVSMVTSTAFDVTLRNLLAPLCVGATVCIAPEALLPEHGLQWLGAAGVSILHVTPSLASSWLAEGAADAGPERRLRWTLFAGEMLTDALVTNWRARNPGAVGNMYGPTETTMSRCLYVVPNEPTPGAQPVGTPLPGSQVLVVDEHQQLCAIGTPGEVLIRTRSGTAGYANNPQENETRFVPNPFTGDVHDLVYRTGDIGWYREDGSLQLAGRVDDQVKIGGVRVEPAEVGATLARHADVRAVQVLPRIIDGREPELIAFIVSEVAASERSACNARLRRHCGNHLAPAAIPARFVHLDRLPLTSNGKVDRRALLAMVDGNDAHTEAIEADAFQLSLSIDEMVAVWRAVLRRDDVEADTNFFDVGGSSVTAVRLGHRLRDRVARPVTIHDLLDAQTPRELHALVHGLGADGPEDHRPVLCQPIHARVRELAVSMPTAMALDDGEHAYTYAELERRTRAVAATLIARGVRPGTFVALHTRRMPALIPILLGIHRAGAAYVPIDPELPSGRVRLLLDDCTASFAITDRALPPAGTSIETISVAQLEEAMAGADPTIADVDVGADPERAAYVIYTSGSTGNPKGVVVPQRALSAFVDAAIERYAIRSHDRLLQYHSLSFDTSVEEIFCSLGAAATLVMPDRPMLGSAGWFLEQVALLRISVLDLPTSFWTGLVDDLSDAGLELPSCLRLVIIGGSAASARSVTRWTAQVGDRVSLINAYGPTETTVAATAAVLTGASYGTGDLVTIGQALRGVTTLVLDSENRRIFDGSPGELFLGGPQLAVGYLNRPELTAERFVIDPTGSTTDTFYRTGDRVRQSPDGSFVFEARVDDQVKIRGYRFELGEIEAAFASHASVREAVAVVEPSDDDPRVSLHVVLRDGHDTSVDALRAHAATQLPSYAMPSRIERRSDIPRTAGGKPDRRALRSGVRAPLGFSQQQQWFLHRLDPSSPAYNLTCAVRVRGDLDFDALGLALNTLIERHEALRTRIVDEDGTPIQVIDEPRMVQLERVQVQANQGEEAIDAARRTLAELNRTHFDLERDLLFRPVIIELDDSDRVLALRSHHIALDGWSTDVLIDELLSAYAAYRDQRAPDLAAGVVQPRELAVGQRASENDGTLAAAIDRWVERLNPIPDPLALPYDSPCPPSRDPQGLTLRRTCDMNSAPRLIALGRTLRTTPFAIGLSLFGEYLAWICNTDDLIIGTPAADRDTPGSDRTVGMLVNSLPLRLRTDRGRTINDAIVATTRVVRDALADKGVPFDRIVRAVSPVRVPGVHPLFQVMFQTTPMPRPLVSVAGLDVEPFASGRSGAKFDCSAELIVGDQVSCRFTFATDVFHERTMNALIDGYAAFVDHALFDPQRTVAEVLQATARTVDVPQRSARPAPPNPGVPTPVQQPGPAPLTPSPTSARTDSTPATLEPLLAIFRDLLGPGVGADDDFFASGGHSLLAIKLCSRVERLMGERLAITAVFDHPTARGLAHLLAGEPMPSRLSEPPAASASPPSAPSPAAVAPSVAQTPSLTVATRDDYTRPTRLWLRRAPLSFAQRRLWTLEQLGQGGAYLLTSAWDLYGEFDLDALTNAMERTADRHEILRTRYIADSEAVVEQIIDPVAKPDVVVFDARGQNLTPAQIDEHLCASARTPFDLSTEHPWRAVVARVTDGHTVLALSVHHIATDGESQGIIQRDLVASYNLFVTSSSRRGTVPPTTPPALQYADHAVWQHARFSSGAMERSLDHWMAVLHPTPEPLQLPSTLARPSFPTGSGSQVTVTLGPTCRAAIEELARTNRTTPFVVMLTAYEILLHRLAARNDIVIGIPVTERTMVDDTDTVGFFVNTMPIRVAIDPDGSAAGLVEATHRRVSDALAHGDAPFDLLVDRLSSARDPAITPIVQTMFSVQEQSGSGPRFEGVLARKRRLGAGMGAKFDMSLIVAFGSNIDLLFEYRDDVFERSLVEEWAQQYATSLDSLVTDPTRAVAALPALDDATQRWLVDGCNRTRTDYPRDRTVPSLFAEVVAQHGDRIAIVDGGRAVTYDELNEQAGALAQTLRRSGVRAGDRVALALGRSLDLVTAMIATMQCGAAYVPIDPTYPQHRREVMLALARACAVVERNAADEPSVRMLAMDEPASRIELEHASPTSPAYVMFTSGSTGTPKSVVIPHRAIVRLVRDTNYVQFASDLVFAHLSNTSFDAATFEIWGALLNGARLVVLDRDTVTSPAAFADAIREHSITTMFVTTALFNVMAREAPGAFATVRDLLFGGEAADAKAVRSVLGAGPPERLLNVYGPTESTTFASWFLIERLSTDTNVVPIGRPIANTTLHVVDPTGRPVPPLVEGELLIGGDGLALEYLDDPELTDARFIPDQFANDPAARLYRTGDIVRRRVDGSIEFVGRRDHQVKIRGFRIELGEVEAALRTLDDVAEVHAAVYQHHNGDPDLVAYVVRTPGATSDGAALRAMLRETHPVHLIPAAVVVLDALPMNANGKIDRNALAPPEPITRSMKDPTPTADPLERVLIGLWCEVLDMADVGIDDNFFETGGNSIRAVQLFAAIERATGARLALSTLFEAPTPRALTALLRKQNPRLCVAPATQESEPSPSLLVTLRLGDPQTHIPLYCVHPAGGHVFAYAPLLASFPAQQPVIGISEYGWGDRTKQLPSVEAYAARYVDEVTAHCPTGPLALAGYSLGGLIAFEMARLLESHGREVAVVLLLDAAPAGSPDDEPPISEPSTSKLRRRAARDGVRGVMGALTRVIARKWMQWFGDRADARRDLRLLRAAERAGREPDPLLLGRISERTGIALRRAYQPRRYDGRVVCFRATGTDPDFPIADYSHRWHRVSTAFEVIDVPGNHAEEGSMLTQPNAAVLGEAMHQILHGIRSRSPIRNPKGRR